MNTLSKWLKINAIFSTINAILMVLFNKELQTAFGFENGYVFPVVAANLLFFAAIIIWVCSSQLSNKVWIYLITGLDALWVLGSLSLMLFKPFGLTHKGYLIIGIVAGIVAFFGWKQFKNSPK